MSARMNKIKGLDTYPLVKSAGWEIVVHGWKKDKSGRWIVREVVME
jgi:hypothetical protein